MALAVLALDQVRDSASFCFAPLRIVLKAVLQVAMANDGFVRRSQWVDATHALKRSAGVS